MKSMRGFAFGMAVLGGLSLGAASGVAWAQTPPSTPNQFRPPYPTQPPGIGAKPQANPAPYATQYGVPAGSLPPNQQQPLSQPPQLPPTRPPQPAAAGTNPAASSGSPSGPPTISSQDRTAANILIKNTLIAVNQGNLTGNFTVLRDLASPGFRARNSAGDLSTIFQNIRQKKVDLSPVVVLDPLIAPPQMTNDGHLLLEGYFASNPMQIKFKLGYIKSESGGWMVDAVSVGVVPAPATSHTNPQQPTQSSLARPVGEPHRPG